MWIGCADARVAADRLLGTEPGNVFTSRNVANMVVNTDTNLMSALTYAVDVLKVKHVIVCGHYDCGGVRAAMDSKDHGSPLEDWLRGIRDVYRLHSLELSTIMDPTARYRRLIELNVVEQTLNVFKTGVVQRRRIQTAVDPAYAFPEPQIHALIFDPSDGRLRQLDVSWNEYFDNLRHVYLLHAKQGQLPMPPFELTQLQDCLEEAFLDPERLKKMQDVFNSYCDTQAAVTYSWAPDAKAREEPALSVDAFGRFVAGELRCSSTVAERMQAMCILTGQSKGEPLPVTFMQILGWWYSLVKSFLNQEPQPTD